MLFAFSNDHGCLRSSRMVKMCNVVTVGSLPMTHMKGRHMSFPFIARALQYGGVVIRRDYWCNVRPSVTAEDNSRSARYYEMFSAVASGVNV